MVYNIYKLHSYVMNNRARNDSFNLVIYILVNCIYSGISKRMPMTILTE